jgi:hypothetical protein
VRFVCAGGDEEGEEAERGISTGGSESSCLCTYDICVFMNAARCVTGYSNCTYCAEHNTGIF